MSGKNVSVIMLVCVAFALAIGCGGGGGGSDAVTYNGSEAEAVADSTNFTDLASYALAMPEAAGPLAGFFLGAAGEVWADPLSAEPQFYGFTTFVTIPFSKTIQGSLYSNDGSGSADVSGTLVLFLGSDSDTAATWDVVEADFEGTVTLNSFDGMGDGLAASGVLTISEAEFLYENNPTININTGDWVVGPQPDTFYMDAAFVTFTDITVTADGDSWSLGEGEWYVTSNTELIGTIDIELTSMTVGYEGQTYKLEDAFVQVTKTNPAAAESAQVQPLETIPVVTTRVDISVTGYPGSTAVFYHPTLGYVYFESDIRYETPPGDITGGSIALYVSGDSKVCTIYFGYDGLAGSAFYNLYEQSPGTYGEKGYIIDGIMTPDPSAPIILL